MGRYVSLETVAELTDSIPSAPVILPKLQKLLSRKQVNIQEIQKIIEVDTGLATSVLRLANTAYYRGEQKIETISEAILRLGTVALSKLISTMQTAKWLNQPVQGYGWETGDLCRHSLCTAVAAEVFSRTFGISTPELAYTAGLIHDVGKLALAYAASDALEEVLQLVPGNYPTWEKGELGVLGYCSTDVSKILLSKWGFSQTLIEVSSYYLHPLLAEEHDRALVTLIHAAKHTSTALGYGVGADGFYYEVDEEALREGGFVEEKLQKCIPLIIERMEELVAPDGTVRALT